SRFYLRCEHPERPRSLARWTPVAQTAPPRTVEDVHKDVVADVVRQNVDLSTDRPVVEPGTDANMLRTPNPCPLGIQREPEFLRRFEVIRKRLVPELVQRTRRDLLPAATEIAELVHNQQAALRQLLERLVALQDQLRSSSPQGNHDVRRRHRDVLPVAVDIGHPRPSRAA